jgi:hypothetical protein
MTRKVKYVVVIVANPTGRDDPGLATEAWYFEQDGVVRLCEEDGTPLGEHHRLAKGEDAHAAAKRLVLKMHRVKFADDGDFWRPSSSLRYSFKVPY